MFLAQRCLLLFAFFMASGCRNECDQIKEGYGLGGQYDDTAIPVDDETYQDLCDTTICIFGGAAYLACYDDLCRRAGYYDDIPSDIEAYCDEVWEERYETDDTPSTPDCPTDLIGTWTAVVGADLYDAATVDESSCLARSVELTMSFVGADITRDAIGVFTGDGVMSSDFVPAVDSYDDGFIHGYLFASGVYTTSGTVEVDLLSDIDDTIPIATLTGTISGTHMELEVAGDPFDDAACLYDVRYPTLYFARSSSSATGQAITAVGDEVVPCGEEEVSASVTPTDGFDEADFQFFLTFFKKLGTMETPAEKHAAISAFFASNTTKARVADVDLVPGTWTLAETLAHQFVTDMATNPHLREVVTTIVNRYDHRESTGYTYIKAMTDVRMAVDRMVTQKQDPEQ
ncbi:MAG: hypothetical protein UX09_C0001G0051 [Candidatus Uhrbacteria bacterium GW2011_GWE2_45_35]|uniref:Lipoprotein n=1 Tax=Candidatus Uhrbacteria bacterium GW2011_GWE2_45_35 TaxID=1618993 RepID=A0A0G1MMC3_9BACT|nr:MAG: hypothetical protein UX09_C0001G0051 [Candidatus Uhrbacteria bacterium GW2011_GWE2_45_35]HBR80459.1 hypothetical protein [Candidatus Uhrbacteria bacterium]HCU31556.1 hypothetical protein [Candidatus Uhrbacteria bacterium]